jgi:hypothetical protein
MGNWMWASPPSHSCSVTCQRGLVVKATLHVGHVCPPADVSTDVCFCDLPVVFGTEVLDSCCSSKKWQNDCQ